MTSFYGRVAFHGERELRGADNEFKYAGRHAERNGDGAAREEMRNRQQGRFTETPWQQRPRANVKRALNR